MKTLIVGASRVKTRTHRRIDQAHVTRIAADHRTVLFAAAIDYDGTIDLWANREVTTLEEIQTIAAFMAETDAPLRWHGVTR